MNYCKDCIHWRNHQQLLNYCEHTGFCLNHKLAFNTTNGRMVGVVDAENLKDQSKVSGNPSHDFENIELYKIQFSRYILQTSEDFGCNFHQKLTKTK